MAEPYQVNSSRWRRAAATLPMRLALLAVAAVWLLGCVWSFEEQTAFAASRHFALPQLLPLVIDGFAAAMAGVAWAASLDARPAIAARTATLLAVAGSAGSNGTWAWIRSGRDLAAVALAVTVPLAANLAFEVLLAELRRQVQRRRGLPAPVPIPHPHLLRLALAPWRTLREWRTLVLDVTAVGRGPTPTAEDSRTDVRTVPSPAPATTLDAPAPPQRSAPAGAAAAQASDAPAPLQEDPAQHEAALPSPSHSMSSGAPAGETPVRERPGRPMVGDRRLDPRAIALAEQLVTMPGSTQVTGEMVGRLLGIELAPRTGRRLLGQARAVMNAGESGQAAAEAAAVGATLRA